MSAAAGRVERGRQGGSSAADHLRDFTFAEGQWAPGKSQSQQMTSPGNAQFQQPASNHHQTGASLFNQHDAHSSLNYPASGAGAAGGRGADLLNGLLPRLPYGGSEAGPQPHAKPAKLPHEHVAQSTTWPTPPDWSNVPPSISMDTALQQHYLQHNDVYRKAEDANLRGALEQQNKELMRLAAAADRRTSEVESSNKQLAREMANMKDQLHIAAANANEEAMLRINQLQARSRV